MPRVLPLPLPSAFHRDLEFYPEDVAWAYHAFNSIFAAVDPGAASRESRSALEEEEACEDGRSLTYGEVSFLSFSAILEMAHVLDGAQSSSP